MADSYLKSKLVERNVRFYHAMNLRGVADYCQMGGVVSRQILLDGPNLATAFWSDEEDKRKGVLDRVFGNIYDFGAIFSRAAKNTTPNIYGPILFVFSPNIFNSFDDIIITNQSIATLAGDWRTQALLSSESVDKMLKGDRYGDPVSPDYQYAELSTSCSTATFDHLEYILVEPLIVGGIPLKDHVQQKMREFGHGHIPVRARQYRRSENIARLQELTDGLEAHQHQGDFNRTQLSFKNPPTWVEELPPKLKIRMEMWLTYMYRGTVVYLRNSKDKTNQPAVDGSSRKPTANRSSGLQRLGECQRCSGAALIDNVSCASCDAEQFPQSDASEVEWQGNAWHVWVPHPDPKTKHDLTESVLLECDDCGSTQWEVEFESMCSWCNHMTSK